MTPDEARAAPMTPDEAWAALRAGKIDAATFFAAAYPNGLRGDSAPIIPKPEEVALKASTPNAIGAPKPTQATPAERADWWVREEPKRREVALTDAIAERILLEPTAAGQEEQKQRLGRIERSGAPAGLREAVGRVMERQTMGGMAAEAQLSKTGAAAKPTFAEVAAPVAHQAPIAASLVGVPPQAEKAGWSLTGLADAATAKLGGAVELGRKALVAADATGGRGPADVTRVFDNLARNHPTLLAALQTAAPALAVIEDLNRVAATAAAEKEPGRTLHGTAPLESATGAALRRLTTPGSLVAEAGWSGAEQMPLTELKVGGKSVYLPGMWGAGVRAGSAALDAAGLKTPWDGLVSVGPTTGLAAPDLAAARGVDDWAQANQASGLERVLYRGLERAAEGRLFGGRGGDFDVVFKRNLVGHPALAAMGINIDEKTASELAMLMLAVDLVAGGEELVPTAAVQGARLAGSAGKLTQAGLATGKLEALRRAAAMPLDVGAQVADDWLAVAQAGGTGAALKRFPSEAIEAMDMRARELGTDLATLRAAADAELAGTPSVASTNNPAVNAVLGPPPGGGAAAPPVAPAAPLKDATQRLTQALWRAVRGRPQPAPPPGPATAQLHQLVDDYARTAARSAFGGEELVNYHGIWVTPAERKIGQQRLAALLGKGRPAEIRSAAKKVGYTEPLQTAAELDTFRDWLAYRELGGLRQNGVTVAKHPGFFDNLAAGFAQAGGGKTQRALGLAPHRLAMPDRAAFDEISASVRTAIPRLTAKIAAYREAGLSGAQAYAAAALGGRALSPADIRAAIADPAKRAAEYHAAVELGRAAAWAWVPSGHVTLSAEDYAEIAATLVEHGPRHPSIADTVFRAGGGKWSSDDAVGFARLAVRLGEDLAEREAVEQLVAKRFASQAPGVRLALQHIVSGYVPPPNANGIRVFPGVSEADAVTAWDIARRTDLRPGDALASDLAAPAWLREVVADQLGQSARRLIPEVNAAPLGPLGRVLAHPKVGAVAGATVGAAVGAAVGSPLGAPGAVLGALVGGTVGQRQGARQLFSWWTQSLTHGLSPLVGRLGYYPGAVSGPFWQDWFARGPAATARHALVPVAHHEAFRALTKGLFAGTLHADDLEVTLKSGRVLNARELVEHAIRGGIGDSVGTIDDASALLRQLGLGARGPLEKAGLFVQTVLGPAGLRQLAGAVDSTHRAAVYLDELDQGASYAAASAVARDVVYDPSALGAFERDVLRFLIPFYAYMRLDVNMAVRTMLRHPDRVFSALRAMRLTPTAWGLTREQQADLEEKYRGKMIWWVSGGGEPYSADGMDPDAVGYMITTGGAGPAAAIHQMASLFWGGPGEFAATVDNPFLQPLADAASGTRKNPRYGRVHPAMVRLGVPDAFTGGVHFEPLLPDEDPNLAQVRSAGGELGYYAANDPKRWQWATATLGGVWRNANTKLEAGFYDRALRWAGYLRPDETAVALPPRWAGGPPAIARGLGFGVAPVLNPESAAGTVRKERTEAITRETKERADLLRKAPD